MKAFHKIFYLYTQLKNEQRNSSQQIICIVVSLNHPHYLVIIETVIIIIMWVLYVPDNGDFQVINLESDAQVNVSIKAQYTSNNSTFY